jgi:hypothetical protein
LSIEKPSDHAASAGEGIDGAANDQSDAADENQISSARSSAKGHQTSKRKTSPVNKATTGTNDGQCYLTFIST